jgi:ribosome biogenesis SPOUT family RNA methylase Rps3
MAAPRGTKQETIDRANRFARIIANGGRRSDCIRFAAENWGVGDRTCDQDIERPQMVADLLSQCSTLQMEARRAGQYHIALGAINTAAKLAQLCS